MATQDTRPDLRQPGRLRYGLRPSQRHRRLCREPRAVRRAAGRPAAEASRRRSARDHRRSRQRSDDAEHRSLARARAGAAARAIASRPASTSARDRPLPISARRWRRTSASVRLPHGTSFLREHNGRRMTPSIREQLEQREREILAPQASKSADSKGRVRKEEEDRDPPGVPARSRSHHPHQGVPPAQAQDAGVLLADRRSLPHAPDAHARSGADCAHHCEGAAAARRADRGDCARSRPGPHAVRPRRRARVERAGARRLQSLRAEPAHRRRAREQSPGAEPDVGSARRHRAALEGQARHAGGRAARTSRQHHRRPGRARRRHRRLRESRHRRCGARRAS